MLIVRVEFLWWASRKIWTVCGESMEDVISKCEKLCYKYHATHYQILN